MTNAKTPLEHAKRRELDGIIRHVDAFNRDLTVLEGSSHHLLDVPSDCSILLNGESVKLRLLQPGDHVRVTYLYRNNVRTAQWIEAGIGRPREVKACWSRNLRKECHE